MSTYITLMFQNISTGIGIAVTRRVIFYFLSDEAAFLRASFEAAAARIVMAAPLFGSSVRLPVDFAGGAHSFVRGCRHSLHSTFIEFQRWFEAIASS